MSMDRIIEMTEVEQPSDNDYVHLQSPTLGDRRIKATNLGGGGGGESVTYGLYFDGYQYSKIRATAFDANKDLEIEMKFWLPSYQSDKAVLGNTANGYCPCCFMNGNNQFVLGAENSQVLFTPQSFEGDHSIIINRLSDKAIVVDGEIVGTYGTMSLGSSPALDIGYGELNGVTTAEFVFKSLKITDRSNNQVLCDYEAAFRNVYPDYKIPCLLNSVDDSYIDLNKGRTDSYNNNNQGHIMICASGET